MTLLADFLAFLLFLGPVVMAKIGWPVEGDIVGDLHYYPAFHILLIYVVIAIFNKNLRKEKCLYALAIVILSLSYFVINKVIGRETSSLVLVNSMAQPALYYIFFNSINNNARYCVRRVVITMFIINSCMAIWERVMMKDIFPFDLIRSDFGFAQEDDEVVFRSSALIGHPLTNSLIMSIVMVYILLSDMMYLKKFVLYGVGMFGLFCFNSRAAILFCALILGLYLVRDLFSKGTSFKKKTISIGLLSVSVVFGFTLLSAGYGGRFSERGDLATDKSTLARIDVWKIFKDNDLSLFMWGMPSDDFELLALAAAGVAHIENWYILSSLAVGLIITTIVVLLFIPLFRHSLKPLDMFSSMLILLIVVGLSSTNNSLACGVPALASFFVCSYAFKVKNPKHMHILHRKKNQKIYFLLIERCIKNRHWYLLLYRHIIIRHFLKK